MTTARSPHKTARNNKNKHLPGASMFHVNRLYVEDDSFTGTVSAVTDNDMASNRYKNNPAVRMLIVRVFRNDRTNPVEQHRRRRRPILMGAAGPYGM
jgi:hypothetical protein